MGISEKEMVMKACPYCAEQIQDAAIYCRYCGHDLRLPVTSEPVVAVQPVAEKKKQDRGWPIPVAGLALALFATLAVLSQRFNSPDWYPYLINPNVSAEWFWNNFLSAELGGLVMVFFLTFVIGMTIAGVITSLRAGRKA
jgi:hypothetical protein